MKTFFDSQHCLTRVHCNTCRDKECGRKWRESLMKTFEDIKEKGADFECPHSLQWGIPKQIIIQPKTKKKIVYKTDGSVEIDGIPCLSCAEKRKKRLEELVNKRKSGNK